ncbi:hypothetical protein PV779_20435 [Streptomyces sp. ID01-9D]|nr:hypothetical protein [Streptomyces sp. ID01-9D]
MTPAAATPGRTPAAATRAAVGPAAAPSARTTALRAARPGWLRWPS